MRPAFTLGGKGGGVVREPSELERVVGRGLKASPIGQVLLEESVLGWGEFELEVMRDRSDNVVIICSIENLDPMGVHTGDSVCVAPQQTLTDKQYQALRDQAIAAIRAVGVETGGSNVQFAVNRATDEIVVIEMNPRVSRSSALASKATGFPIAKIAARLAVGYTLQEIPNDITRATPASFEPAIDYCVVKWPRFAFEKFPGAESGLTTHMKSVGEAMAIGRTFKQAFAKALRSRELDLDADRAGRRRGAARARSRRPAPDRFDHLLEALAPRRRDRRGAPPHRHRPVVPARAGRAGGRPGRRRSPASGTFKSVDTCAAEFAARTPYYYSGWERPRRGGPDHEVERGDRESVVILGSGPNRIGQGIEFDYCCVHAAQTVREPGRDAVMVNCNPETVSTDYDTSDRLYFEPLTLEDVLAVCEVEKPRGVIVQFGGQTPLKLADGLDAAGVPILGTSIEAIDLAEDRARFGPLLDRLGYKAPRYATARSAEEALERAPDVGFPLLVRPELRARRTRHGDRLQRRRAARLPASASARPRAPRSISTASSRTRSRSTSTRCATATTCGSPASCSTSRRPGSTPATRHACCPPHTLGDEMLAEIASPDRGHRPGARGGGAAERAVRDPRRPRAVCDRGQPARVAHGPVRLQGDRAAAGEAGLPDACSASGSQTSIFRPTPPTATSASRRSCCRSTASPEPTRCSGRRCARPAR